VNKELAKALEKLAAGSPYLPQAYYFVLQGLEFAKTHVQHEVAPDAEGVRHFDAVDLCWCLHDLAILQCSEHARVQLRAWGITSTDDFGEIVFTLVKAGLIRASERDRQEDFQNVFDFAEEFQYGPHWAVEITEEDAAAFETSRESLRTPPRFGLKALLIVVTLFCLGAGWFGWRWRYAQFQQQLVADIRATGGLVYYDRSLTHQTFGQDFSANLHGISLTGGALTPELAARIARVKGLRTLQMCGSTIEPGAMAQVAQIPQLGSLQISGGEIHDEQAFAPLQDLHLLYLTVEKVTLTDEQVRQIGCMTRVERLDLSDMPLTDEHLEHLKELTQLRSLSLANTSIEGPGLRRLAGMRLLESLDLSGTAVDDRGFGRLPPLPRLNVLMLSNTKITDAAVATLPQRPSLENVYLSFTAITDASLAPLGELPQLVFATADGTAITEAAADKFNQLKPRRRVINTQWTYQDAEGVSGVIERRPIRQLRERRSQPVTSPAAGCSYCIPRRFSQRASFSLAACVMFAGAPDMSSRARRSASAAS
jgi:uncharacterized repeat protein (TIGR04138 family)